MSTHAKAAPGSGRGPARPELVTPTLLRAWPLPGGGSGKDDRGSVLVIGGARMTPGAALLAGVAALRSGAGRLTLAVAESVAVHLAVALPEAGVLRLPETASGTVKGSSAAAVLAAPVEAADAVLIGPGLDDKDEATALLRGLLKVPAGKQPPAIILDAFALGSLPELAGELGPWAGRLILTPNVTEAGILLGHDAGELARDVPELAEKYGAVVSCQGVIARPVGRRPGGLRRHGRDSRPMMRLATEPGPRYGRSPPDTAAWARRAPAMCCPGPLPGCGRGEPRTRRPPAGEPICMRPPATGSPAGWAVSATSPANSRRNCRR